MMLHCHCRDCQRSSGGPYSSFVIVPTEAFKLLQGSLSFHASLSEMGGKAQAKIANIEGKIATLMKMKQALSELFAACQVRTSLRDCPILEFLEKESRIE